MEAIKPSTISNNYWPLFMNKSAKIFVAGYRGMVGSAVYRKLQREGFTNLIARSSSELDLRDQMAVAGFFAAEKPEYVFWLPPKWEALLPIIPTVPILFMKT